jgi:hypothetical protein
MAVYSKMAGMMRKQQSRVIVGVNEFSETRRAFAGLKMSRVTTAYTVGGGSRGKAAVELVIRNW